MNRQAFVMEKTLNVPIAMVWAALTNLDEMKKWYFDIDTFKPEVGVEFTFTGCGPKGEEYVHLCKVTEVIPGKKVSYTWRYSNYPGLSEVTFELFEVGDKTRLKLTHAGLETFDPKNPDFARSSFEGGWNEIIGKMLPEYLAKGI
jgi:uncharacterized protein YndB with AHSA1/START domain